MVTGSLFNSDFVDVKNNYFMMTRLLINVSSFLSQMKSNKRTLHSAIKKWEIEKRNFVCI